jgi:hypothetical protein
MSLSQFRTLLLVLLLITRCGSASASSTPPVHSFVGTDSAPGRTLFDPAHKVIYVTVPGLSEVVVISTSQHAIIARIPVPSAFSMDLSPDGSQLLVGGGYNSNEYASPFLTLIDTSTLQVTNRIPVPLIESLYLENIPVALAWTSNGTVLMVVNEFETTGDGVLQWDPSKNSFRPRTLPVDAMMPEGLKRSADRSKVVFFDSSTSGSNLVLYDATTDDFTANTVVPGPGIAVNSDGSQFAAEGVYRLMLLDSSLNQSSTLIISSFSGSPLFSADGTSLYVSENNGYTVLDTTTFAPKGAVPAFGSTLDGIDDVGELYGTLNRGVAFNGFPSVTNLPAILNISSITPNSGALSSPSPVTVNGDGFGTGDALYFGGQLAGGITVESSASLTSTPPAASVPGAVDVVLTTPAGGATLAAQGYAYGPTIAYVQTNAGSTAGGTPLQIYGYGFNYESSQIQVSVGGRPAAVTRVGTSSYNSPLEVISATSPSGTTGSANISVTTPAGNAVLKNGFLYYAFSTAAGPTSTGQMLFDHGRQVLYVTDDNANQVDVISPISNQVIGNLPSGNGPLGLSLTPDGSTLVVANWSSQSVSIVNIAAGTQQQIVLNPNGTGPGSLYPTSVAVANNGKALLGATDIGALDNGDLFELDLASGQMTLVSSSGLYLTSDIELHPFLGGSKIWVGSGSRGGSSSMGAAIWDATSGTFTPYSVGPFPESDILDNGIVTAAGSAFYNPEGQLFSSAAPLDLITYPYIAYGVRLHPGGGLFFRPYTMGQTSLSAVGVFDVNTGTMLRQIGIPANPGSAFDTMALDDTGNRIFFSSDAGIVTVNLSPFQLSIGTLSPNQGLTTGGDHVIVRGSSFQSGAVVSLGGIASATTWTDQNTLQITTPPETAGQVAVSVKNPDGSSYSVPASFTYVSSIPVITSIDPASANPGNAIALSVYGSNFAPGATIRWNGLSQITTFIDSSSLQTVVSAATVGTNVTNAKITVLDPDNAVSSSFSLPVVNPPAQLAWDLDSFDFGAQQVRTASQPLTTYLGNPGVDPASPAITTTGDFSQTNNCPSTMQSHTSCTVLVTFTPTADGVRSGSLIANAAGEAPQITTLSGRGIPSGPALTSTPYNADFGQTFIGSVPKDQYQINIYSVGSSDASISSVTVSGDYQIAQNTCQGVLAIGSWCYVFLTFAPTASGTYTGNLKVASNAADTPLVVPLTGVGVQPFVVSPASLTFPSQVVGTSTTQQITVQNTNKATVSALTGIDTPPSFNATSNCGENIYPGTTCTVSVTFAPGLPGNANGTMVLWEEAGGLQEMVDYPLAGTGSDFELTLPQGASNTATVAAGQTAAYSLSLTDSGYSGTVTIACTGAPDASTCAANPASTTLNGSTPQAISITVQTTAPTASTRASTSGSGPILLLWATGILAPMLLSAAFLSQSPHRSKVKRTVPLAFLFLAGVGLLSCGGGGGTGAGGGGGGGGGGGTPPGNYTLVLTATSAGANRTTNLILNVQ